MVRIEYGGTADRSGRRSTRSTHAMMRPTAVNFDRTYRERPATSASPALAKAYYPVPGDYSSNSNGDEDRDKGLGLEAHDLPSSTVIQGRRLRRASAKVATTSMSRYAG